MWDDTGLLVPVFYSENQRLLTRYNSISPMSDARKNQDSVLSTNRKARHNYHIIDTYEAGIALVGTEVKSMRESHFSIDEAFAEVTNNEVWIQQMRIEPYKYGNQFNHQPVRPRKLLLHREEIRRLKSKLAEQGYTLVALDVHLRRGRIKVTLGLGKGKAHQDKREDLKKRDANREAQRAISDARRR